ncbi:DNA-invertase hin [compost metagenome]
MKPTQPRFHMIEAANTGRSGGRPYNVLMKVRAVLYIRVSTDEQVEEGFSIEGQKNRLRSYCESQDWDIVRVYIDDGYSAKDLNRPEMQQLIKDVQNNAFDIVVIYKLNRLTRSAADCDYLMKLFDRHDIKFQSCTESYETRSATGRLFIRLMADIAQWERENIAENVRFGMEQMVKEGKRPGGPVPYGYEKNAETAIPTEAKVLREVRRLYMKGYGYKSTAILINSRGPEWLRRGKNWSAGSVYYVLDNPYYAGLLRWGGKKSNGKYSSRKKEDMVECTFAEGPQERIFSRDEYEAHAERMKKRSFKGYRQVRQYWFAGVLRCAKCGNSMTGRYHQNKRKDGSYNKILSYICSSRQMGTGCTMPMFRQELVEHLVLEYIKQIKIDHDTLKEISRSKKKEMAAIEAQVAELRKELQQVYNRRKKFQYAYANDMMEEKELRERLSEEKHLEKELIEQINRLHPSNEHIEQETQLFEMLDMWPLLDDQEKNELIQTIFKNIELDTPLEKAHGKKGQYIPSSIKSIEFA